MPLPYNGGYHETAAGTGRQCLPEIATGAKRPRNDKSENLAPLNLCRDHGLPRERPRNGKAEGFPHSSFFIFQSSGFIHFRAPPLQRTPRQGTKKLRSFDRSLCWRYLSSRAVTRKVLSAQMSLTSVFGMETGVPSPQSTPTIYLSSGFCPRTFIIIPPLDSLVKRFFGDPSGIRTHVNGVRGRCLNHLTMGPWCTFTDSNRGPTD